MASYSFQPTKAFSAAWKIYTPPPLRTKSAKSIFTASGQSGFGFTPVRRPFIAPSLQVWITTSYSANRGRHAAHAAVLGSIGAVLTENFEATGCRQDAPQQNRSLLPVVVAESINNKHANLVFSGIG